MWVIILATFMIIAYLLEAIFAFPFLVIVALSLAFVERPKVVSIFAFIAGILIDVSTGRLLGETSLFLLVTSLIIHLYKRKFTQDSIIFMAVFVFVAMHIYNYVFEGVIAVFITYGILSSLMVLVVSYLLDLFKNSASHE